MRAILLASLLAVPATRQILLKDINPGANSSSPTSLVAAGSLVFFVADDGATGAELWKTDGTPAGTVMVTDINPLFGASSFIGGMVALGSSVVFSAIGPSGQELYTIARSSLDVKNADLIGSACLGSVGFPKIAAIEAPELGNTGFGVGLSKARASTPCALFLNNARLDVPIGGGCTIYPAIPVISVSSSTNPSGDASIALPVPNVPANVGVQLWFQWAVIDAGGAWYGSGSFTGGLRIVISDV